MISAHALDLAQTLVRMNTVSHHSNLELIHFIRDHLARLGVKSRLTYNAEKTKANLFASVSSGICALWGRLHGGANAAVIQMLTQMLEGRYKVKSYLEMVKRKEQRLMGFGHRVYKNFDPRARVLKKAADNLLLQSGRPDPLMEIAQELEDAALHDDYFQSRQLYPNVDFYSGIILRALGIPVNMFPVMFAIGRMPGWIAHWHEENRDVTTRIHRPRQIYTGPAYRPYVPLDQR